MSLTATLAKNISTQVGNIVNLIINTYLNRSPDSVLTKFLKLIDKASPASTCIMSLTARLAKNISTYVQKHCTSHD